MLHGPAPFALQALHLAGPSYLPSEISKRFVAYVRLEDEPQTPSSAKSRHRLALELTLATTAVEAEPTWPGAARAVAQSPKEAFGKRRCRRPRNAAPASAAQGDEQAQSTHWRRSTYTSGLRKAAKQCADA